METSSARRWRRPGAGHRVLVTLWATLAAAAACTPANVEVLERAPNSLRMDLWGYWPLDGTTLDLSDQAHPSQLAMGSGSWLPAGQGQFGGALHFEPGTEVAVSFFPSPKASFSLSLWVRLAETTFPEMFTTLVSTEHVLDNNTGNKGGWQANVVQPANNGAAFFQFGYWIGPGVGDYAVSNIPIAAADRLQWIHLVAVLDASVASAMTLTFYRDAVPSATPKPVTKKISTPGILNSTLYMGRWEGQGRLFKGDLDEVVIYNRALTAAEVETLYKRPASSDKL